MGPKTVHLAVYDGMADWEVGYAIAHINSPMFQRLPGAYRVVTVGMDADTVTTMGGLAIRPDSAIGSLDPRASAMLIMPGSEIALTGGISPVAEAAQRFVEAGVPVAAICGATAALARHGLLDRRRHTSNAPEVLAMTGYGGAAHYVDAPAVTDGAVITASGIAPIAFAKEIFRALQLYTEATLDAWLRLYRDNDASAYATLAGGASAS
ncbi:MAG: DJ-1/PfpI family protein [Azospirillaceae bacterium]